MLLAAFQYERTGRNRIDDNDYYYNIMSLMPHIVFNIEYTNAN